MAWSKVISSLPANATEDITIEAASNCFRQFNQEFNEAYRKQSTWIITDHKIRDEIKISIAKKILPAYRFFYEKYRGVFRGVDSVVKYAPDDLGNYLSDLFHGTGAPGSVNTTSHSSSSSSSLSRSHWDGWRVCYWWNIILLFRLNVKKQHRNGREFFIDQMNICFCIYICQISEYSLDNSISCLIKNKFNVRKVSRYF